MAENATPHIFVEFLNMPVEDVKASAKEGRPIFKDVEHCRIRWVGDKGRELIEPAHQYVDRDPQTNRPRSYAQKFSEHYRLFKAEQDQMAVNGTPLSEVPFLTEAKRAELRALNVFTLEGLADMDGAMLGRIGIGGRELKNKAQAFIDAAAGSAGETRLAEELAARDAEIEALKRQMDEVMANFAGQPVVVSDETHVSPFQGYDDNALRDFIEQRSGKTPHHKLGRTKLMEMAEALISTESEAA